MRVWRGQKISGSDFKIRATNFKKQATNFFIAPIPLKKQKTAQAFFACAVFNINRYSICLPGPVLTR